MAVSAWAISFEVFKKPLANPAIKTPNKLNGHCLDGAIYKHSGNNVGLVTH